MRQALSTTLLLLFLCSPLAGAQALPGNPVPLPVGIADPAGRTGFFSNPIEGIDAVDLATGRLVWRTHEAQKPLFVLGDRLYAQAGRKRNRLRILAFDRTASGRVDLESDPVVLPRWAVTGPAPGTAFTPRWRLQGRQLVLNWTAEAWPATRPALPEVALAVRKRAAGTARIDLLTGKVTTGPAEPAPAEPARAPRYLEKLHVRWQMTLGDKLLALLQQFESVPAPSFPTATGGETGFGRPGPGGLREGRQAFVLRTWDRHTDRVLANRVLMRGRRLRFALSLGEEVLFLREARPSPDLLSPEVQDKAGRWHLFSREGLPLGELPHVPGTEALAVQGGRVFVLVAGGLARAFPALPGSDPDLGKPTLRPRTVQVFDLATGQKRWERAVAGKLLLPPSS